MSYGKRNWKASLIGKLHTQAQRIIASHHHHPANQKEIKRFLRPQESSRISSWDNWQRSSSVQSQSIQTGVVGYWYRCVNFSHPPPKRKRNCNSQRNREIWLNQRNKINFHKPTPNKWRSMNYLIKNSK